MDPVLVEVVEVGDRRMQAGVQEMILVMISRWEGAHEAIGVDSVMVIVEVVVVVVML